MKKIIIIIFTLFLFNNSLLFAPINSYILNKLSFLKKTTMFLEKKKIKPNHDLLFLIYRYSIRYQFNPEVIFAIAFVESTLRPRLVSKNRDGSLDLGLMQINNKYHNISVFNVFNPEENLQYALEYLSHLTKVYKQDAYWRYNGSKKYIHKITNVLVQLD